MRSISLSSSLSEGNTTHRRNCFIRSLVSPELALAFSSNEAVRPAKPVADKIIQFLAQIENYQKKIWEKKKFVVETNYCITIDRVPEELYAEILQNEEQCNEWINLFKIDDIETTLISPAYSNPLTIEFLNGNQSLLVDTKFFDDSFKAKLIHSFDSFDEQCDGVLVHSNNFHGLKNTSVNLRNK